MMTAGCGSSGGSSSGGSSSSGSSGSSSGSTSGGTYAVGVPVPMTGADAQSGTEIFNAEKLAAGNINAAGGVLGHKIVLNEQDDACDPQTSVAAANKLVSQGVKAVVGGYCSGAAQPAEPVYSRAGIPDILAAPNSSALVQGGDKSVFLLDPTSAAQSATAAKFFADILHSKKVQVIDDQSAFGVNLAGLVMSNLKKMGVKTASVQAVPATQSDFSSLIDTIRSNGSSAVYWAGYYAEGGLLVKQMRAAQLNIPFVAADGSVDPAFISTAGAAANGTYASIARTSQFLRGSAAQKFTSQYQAKFGSAPGPYSAYGYDAIEALAAAAKQAKSIDPSKVISALHSLHISGLTGSISFAANGARQGASFVILEVVNGQYRLAPHQP
jgi:branched-chain amino acid transport system substrate-binding protein